MCKNRLSLLVLFLLFGVFASGIRASEEEIEGSEEDESLGQITERIVVSGSSTKPDSLITQVWEDYSAGGIGTTHLVFECIYYANADWDDTRDSLGAGQVWYESHDDEKTKEWQWTNGFESGSQQVLAEFGGYHSYYQGIDDYTLYGMVGSFERFQDLWRSNATEASFDPVINATQEVTGTDSESEFIWDELVEYMTVESETEEDFSSNPLPGLPKLMWGYLIERSETVSLPVQLNVTTTEWWLAFIGGVWTQQQTITITVEDGPWEQSEDEDEESLLDEEV